MVVYTLGLAGEYADAFPMKDRAKPILSDAVVIVLMIVIPVAMTATGVWLIRHG